MKRWIYNILIALWTWFWRWLKNVLIAFDQLVNALFCGYPDETLSARCWREQRRYAIYWIDLLFRLIGQGKDHCELSYQHEMERKDLPEVYRERMRNREGAGH